MKKIKICNLCIVEDRSVLPEGYSTSFLRLMICCLYSADNLLIVVCVKASIEASRKEVLINVEPTGSLQTRTVAYSDAGPPTGANDLFNCFSLLWSTPDLLKEKCFQ